MRTFDGKVCVVTGAASGIGRALAVQLAEAGARLAVSDVDEKGLADTVARCRALGGEARGYPLDVADRKAMFEHAAAVEAEHGRAALVINNAGVVLSATVAESRMEDLEWVLAVNFWGVVHGTQAFLPQLVAEPEAHLVNMSSLFGLIAVPKQAGYCAAKFAVRGFTEAVRQELKAARSRVAVSCVHPGGVRTAIVENARVGASEDKAHTEHLFGRLAQTTAEEAATQILSGVRKRKPRILVGPDAKALSALARLLGGRYQGPLALATRFSGY